jgi:hypothetical protein
MFSRIGMMKALYPAARGVQIGRITIGESEPDRSQDNLRHDPDRRAAITWQFFASL